MAGPDGAYRNSAKPWVPPGNRAQVILAGEPTQRSRLCLAQKAAGPQLTEEVFARVVFATSAFGSGPGVAEVQFLASLGSGPSTGERAPGLDNRHIISLIGV